MYVQALILQLRQLCWNVLKTTSENCYPVPNRLAYMSDGETRFLLTSIKVKIAPLILTTTINSSPKLEYLLVALPYSLPKSPWIMQKHSVRKGMFSDFQQLRSGLPQHFVFMHFIRG